VPKGAALGRVAITPSIEITSLMELDALLRLLDRWKHHPLYPDIIQALHSEYVHTFIGLAAASFLEDAGNGVIWQKTGAGRAADLLIIIRPQEYIGVEIKVPTALCTPKSTLSDSETRSLVKTALKRAGTGVSGQLSPTRPGLLVIGGFHLRHQDIDTLARAATHLLEKAARAHHHAHLLGIMVIDVGVLLEFKESPNTEFVRKPSSLVKTRIVNHLGYHGDVKLSTAQASTLRPTPGNLFEVSG
jgi:hypothetical protein